ncbi:MAG: site-specific DNA-methyltransferase [Dehalococcoidales bacterium]|nr:site-specific DNA-methyltransferase [Dehalococcoidales bacterium]
MDTNVLYYGDNLKILREHIPDESVDLIYLDPPFNSNANYNVLFKEPSGRSSAAQMEAFEDTWQWGLESERALQDMAVSAIAPAATKEFISVLPNFVGQRTAMRAYLTMMAVRLVELRRVLKDTGSIYLHCDPTASHYLKLLMDTIFGANNFRNDIIWQRTRVAKRQSGFWGKNYDNILFYTKREEAKFNEQFTPHPESYKDSHYHLIESETGRRYGLWDFTQTGDGLPRRFGEAILTPPPGKHWIWSQERIDQGIREGRIVITSGGMPRLKRYLDVSKGEYVQSIWQDVFDVNSMAKERLGYATQKPEALLERIIQASSNEGDIVLDPFCGCGTAIVAAQKLNRKWIGIDITHLAIGLMKWRLKNMTPPPSFRVVGEPEDLGGAIELFNQDKYQFQWWTVSIAGGQPFGGKKKGADTGIDGYLYYMDEKDKIKKAIISVKGGGVQVSMIRDLGHVIDREKADIGVFLTLEKPTKPMIEEAALKGFYHSPLGRDYPRLQILTIEELLSGKMPDIPPWIAPITQTQARKRKGKTARLL